MTKTRTTTKRLIAPLVILTLGVLVAAGLLAVAVAQSKRISFSLNSPASFPVDIKMHRLIF